MTVIWRRVIVTTVVGVVGAALLLSGRPSGTDRIDARLLSADTPSRWYRGNIHTHSLWSDGDDYPEMIGLWYKEHGYDFLCYTDHNVLATTERWIDVLKNKGGQRAYDKLQARFPGDWIEERTVVGRQEVRLKKFGEVLRKLAEPGKFLLIQGEEITDRFGNLPVHLNATNIQELIPPMQGGSVYDVMQNNVNAVIAQRERTKKPILVHLNHPNFGYGVTAEDLLRVRGENFFEVYNGHPSVNNSGDAQHASAERMWDIMLTRRLAELQMPVMYGLAVDDGHNYHNIPSRAAEPGRGWVMVLADALTPESLINAMEQGRFYSTSGVELASVKSSAAGLDVEVQPAAGLEYTSEFIGTRKNYDRHSEPVLNKDGQPLPVTRRYSEDIGRVFQEVTGTKASYEFQGDEIYVRCRVTSSKKHPNPSEIGELERAWTQPILGPVAKGLK